MKNTMKKITMLFAVVIIAVLFGVSASAGAQEEYKFNELSNGSLEITQYVGSKTEIYIPSEINGKTVTSIASYAFSGCSSIEKVVLPDCITKLGKNIFSGCTKLTSINLPKNLKVCLYDHSVDTYTGSAGAIIYKHYYYGPFASSNIVNIIVPDGLAHIPEYTFYGCNTIKKITLPSSIKTVGSYAFYSTNKLSHVYYAGTNDDFSEIQINSNNTNLLNAEWHMDHIHSYSSNILVEPTCTLSGITQYICECAIEIMETVEATGHSYVEEVTVNATCKDYGLKTYKCFCGDTYTEKINKLTEHSYITKVTDSTCSTEGFTTYTCECGNTYRDNYQPLKNHLYTIYALYQPETCTSDRILRSSCDYECGKFITVKVENTRLQHNYFVLSDSLDATCTEDGYTESKKCTLCGDVIDKILIPAKGHSYNAILTESTCAINGYTTYTCECGDTYVDDYTDTLDHEYTSEITIPATHTSEGVKTFTCECGDSYTDSIAKTDVHTYSAAVTKDTCTADGYTIYTCVCGDTYKETINSTGHIYDGSKCINCGEDKADTCSCNCHKSGISAIIWKIINLFNKLLRKNNICSCGAAHY